MGHPEVTRRDDTDDDAKPARPSLAERILGSLPGLTRFVRRRMGPDLAARESASDIVQSTCRELLSAAPNFEERGELPALGTGRRRAQAAEPRASLARAAPRGRSPAARLALGRRVRARTEGAELRAAEP